MLLTKKKREKLLRTLHYMNGEIQASNINRNSKIETQKCFRQSLFILKAIKIKYSRMKGNKHGEIKKRTKKKNNHYM